MEEEDNEIRIGDIVKLKSCPDDEECFFIGPVFDRRFIESYRIADKLSEELIGLSNIPGILIFDTNCPTKHSSHKKVRYFLNDEALLWI